MQNIKCHCEEPKGGVAISRMKGTVQTERGIATPVFGLVRDDIFLFLCNIFPASIVSIARGGDGNAFQGFSQQRIHCNL